MASKYRVSPELTPNRFRTDVDAGSSAAVTTKNAMVVPKADFDAREHIRQGARELDAMGERTPGLTRQQRDKERGMPRATVAPLGHPRMERRLPAAGEVRTPLSSRQRKARSVTKQQVRRKTPQTQRAEVARALNEPQRWQHLNDSLSRAVGDVQQLRSEDDVRDIQRMDRAIQAYERDNDRGHVVYCNVAMPRFINSSNVDGFARKVFRPGNRVSFDRFTGTSHDLHQLDDDGRRAGMVAFEIQTRRGMYTGNSDSVDNTSHLLPRGMTFEVMGVQSVGYQRPDGSSGRRLVVQLVDRTEEGTI